MSKRRVNASAMFNIYRSQDAIAPLTQAWENADANFREAIWEASRGLDRDLQSNPQEQGESREGHTRILFRGPVGVLYQVDEARRLVSILRTWAFRPRRAYGPD
jgi:hypothetical protein